MKPAAPSFESPDDASNRLSQQGYIPSMETATAAFLADRLEKPMLVEGPAGVGKTELARSMARALGRELIRLQCYEGLDEAKSLYEWEYAKQLLYTQLLQQKIAEKTAGAATLAEAADRVAEGDSVFFSERFLLPRPVLKAILSPVPCLLLIDEVDKADAEFEAFLLEMLADYAVTVPELGTFRAKTVPRVVLTSNNSRELSDALRRRCLHLHIDFPSRERELRILRARLPHLEQKLAEQLVEALVKLRSWDLRKPPSLSEGLDWAQSLCLLGADTLSAELLSSTLHLIVKHRSDAEKVRAKLPALISG